nr:polysaccharide deacetylase family protein [Sporosarcina sp. E16_8]
MELYQKGYILLPEKSFMITIDDGFVSVYNAAYPILKELGMKATLFVITSHIESGERFGVQMASWGQLKEMSDSGYVEIGNHTHDFHWRGNNNQKGYEAMITNSTQDGEEITSKQREYMIIMDLKIAHELILKNVGTAPIAFSYPYGAHDKVAERAVKKAGYTVNHTIIEDVNYSNEGSEYIKRYGINNEVSSKRLLNKMRVSGKRKPVQTQFSNYTAII